jgi:hypothetical protein
MRLTLTMTVTAIGSLIFGMVFLLFPNSILNLYGTSLESNNLWIARSLGALILGFAVINWLGRKVESGIALRAIIMSDFIVSVIGLIITILNLFGGPSNWMVWSSAVMYLLLAIGYGDFVFRIPPAA